MMETCFSYCGGRSAYFSSDEQKWINFIKKMADERPDEVKIIMQPENNDKCIYAKVPVTYFKLMPKQIRNLTDEQREAARQRGIKLAEARRASRERNDSVVSE